MNFQAPPYAIQPWRRQCKYKMEAETKLHISRELDPLLILLPNLYEPEQEWPQASYLITGKGDSTLVS